MPASHPVHVPGSRPAFKGPVEHATLAVGAVFLTIGVLGLVPRVTAHYGHLTFAGQRSDAAVFGVFDASILHNVVHLGFGAAAIALARTFNGARSYLIGGGLLYLALFALGPFVWSGGSAHGESINGVDEWLHLGLAFIMIALGVILRHTPADLSPTNSRQSAETDVGNPPS